MAGAFDFYVDESLLEQLLGGGDSSKARKAGAAKPAPVHAPPIAVRPAPKPAAKAEAGPIAAALPVEAPVEADPATLSWLDADRLFAAGEHGRAAESYERAASLTDRAGGEPSSTQSTLLYNAGVAWLQAGDLERAAHSLRGAQAAQPEARSVRLALALALLRLSRPQEALSQILDPMLASDPADPDALLGRMQALCALGDFDQANGACEQFRAHHPSSEAGFEATLALRAATQDRDGVERAALDLLELHPNATAALKVLAAVAIARRDFEAAAGHCDALTAPGRDADFEVLIHAAAAYQSAGRFEQAAAAAQRALALRPESFEAASRLAESQQKLERWDEALASYRAAIALDPNCPEALWNLSLVQERLGLLDDASQTLTGAVRIRTDWQDASLRLASLHVAAKRYPEATAVLEHCLMLRKDWPEALYQLGTALHRSGHAGPAQDAVLKALELKPDESAWIEYLEQIAVERDDALVALDCHEKLAESNIESPEMAYNLGVVLQNENEPELAAKCYVRALEQKPDFGAALLNLGHALRDLGREEEARACWSKAVRLDPALAAGYFPD